MKFLFLLMLATATSAGTFAQTKGKIKARRPSAFSWGATLPGRENTYRNDSLMQIKAKNQAAARQRKPAANGGAVKLKDPFTPGAPDDEPRNPFDTSKIRQAPGFKKNQHQAGLKQQGSSVSKPVANAKSTDVAIEQIELAKNPGNKRSENNTGPMAKPKPRQGYGQFANNSIKVQQVKQEKRKAANL